MHEVWSEDMTEAVLVLSATNERREMGHSRDFCTQSAIGLEYGYVVHGCERRHHVEDGLHCGRLREAPDLNVPGV